MPQPTTDESLLLKRKAETFEDCDYIGYCTGMEVNADVAVAEHVSVSPSTPPPLGPPVPAYSVPGLRHVDLPGCHGLQELRHSDA